MRKTFVPLRQLLLGLLALFSMTAGARFITPDEVITAGPLKADIEKLGKDTKATAAIDAVKKAADGGDKDAQFAYAFLLHQNYVEAPKDTANAQEWAISNAKSYYKKAADAGQMAAKNNLGLLKVATGDDRVEAKAIIEEAANAGYGKARITLAQMYIDGVGVEKDVEVALRWLQRAQDTEFSEATYLIALVQEAMGDHASAVANLEKASEKNYLAATMYLGNKFLNGSGVQQDLTKAREYFGKAVNGGANAAKVNLGLIEEAIASQEKDEAKKQAAFKKALALYQEAADLKVTEAFNKLGYFYEKGLGVEKSEEKAFEWYAKGAEAGAPISMHNLAIMNEEGRGTKDKKKNDAEALRLLYMASLRGFSPSQAALGTRYREGRSVVKDPIAGMAWLEKSAEAGNIASQIELASMLERGEAGFVNFDTAAKLYADAANKGQPIAMLQLAAMLDSGRGFQQPDSINAYALCKLASKICENAKATDLQKQADDMVKAIKGKLSVEQIAKAEEAANNLIGGATIPGGATNTPKATETPKPPASTTPATTPNPATAPKPSTPASKPAATTPSKPTP